MEPDYKQLYFDLFNDVTDALRKLEKAQKRAKKESGEKAPEQKTTQEE